MTALGTLPGGNASYASGINDSGQVVGGANTASAQHAFLYSGGAMTDLGTLPGGNASYASGINVSGQVVGAAGTASATHAFLYSGGVMTDLGTLPGGNTSYAYGINDSGQVVGFGDTASGATHAFLYSGGVMTDLGTLPGGNTSYAYGINDSGQVVGWSDTASGAQHAFLYSGGAMTDLGTLPGGGNSRAFGINNSGQVVGSADTASGATHAFLYGSPSPISILNPFSPDAVLPRGPSSLDVQTVLTSVPATSLSADGDSAVVLAYRSGSPQPVTFSLSAGITVEPGAAGSLGPWDPNYLVNPVPAGNSQSYQAAKYSSGPDADGNYVFLALLWAPKVMPTPDAFPLVILSLTAAQPGQPSPGTALVQLEPPPLLLVHGIWSSAEGAGFTRGAGGFYDYVAQAYPHNFIFPVNYGIPVGSVNLNSLSFGDSRIQDILLSAVKDALAYANASGMAARTVDVVAHSMGGLVARYLISTPGSLPPVLLPNPVHNLITIGTPHLGSNLATALVNNKDATTVLTAFTPPEVQLLCLGFSSCTLGDAMGALGHRVDTGAESLEPGSTELMALSSSNIFTAIAGSAPTPLSVTEIMLDILINTFLPGRTVGTILNGQPNDTIVPVPSQIPPGAADSAPPIAGIVHTSLCGSCDTGEAASPSVWAQAYHWLTGGTGSAPQASAASAVSAARRPMPATSAAPAPVLNLSGYTQVAASNVSFQPATGSTLAINSAVSITAASLKTINEVLLVQTVEDPSDAALLYSTQSPFAISFTPARLGSANFGAITVFSDNTYAITSLSYTLQPSGTPYALNLSNTPSASMPIGSSRVIDAKALFPTGPVNVTQAATYTPQSGSTSVFSVGSGGTITATGSGVDLLNVSYGGVTGTAFISVGGCTYSLNPTAQIVPYTGGTATIQVLTQPGCAWTASGGTSWLPFLQASGSGSGSILLTAGANSSGATQNALVSMGGLTALVTQPATSCSYGLSQNLINAPAVGANGSVKATSACPVIASSNQSWLAATPLGSLVEYNIASNTGASQRSATLTIGTVAVSVTQAAFNPCNLAGNASVSAADIQLMINEALGSITAASDLNGDGLVNIVDVQIEINAALGLPCAGQ